ncbi:hypothetical protein VTK26DRAFT_1763 [Humicola hyalothermophila]
MWLALIGAMTWPLLVVPHTMPTLFLPACFSIPPSAPTTDTSRRGDPSNRAASSKSSSTSEPKNASSSRRAAPANPQAQDPALHRHPVPRRRRLLRRLAHARGGRVPRARHAPHPASGSWSGPTEVVPARGVARCWTNSRRPTRSSWPAWGGKPAPPEHSAAEEWGASSADGAKPGSVWRDRGRRASTMNNPKRCIGAVDREPVR